MITDFLFWTIFICYFNVLYLDRKIICSDQVKIKSGDSYLFSFLFSFSSINIFSCTRLIRYHSAVGSAFYQMLFFLLQKFIFEFYKHSIWVNNKKITTKKIYFGAIHCNAIRVHNSIWFRRENPKPLSSYAGFWSSLRASCTIR